VQHQRAQQRDLQDEEAPWVLLETQLSGHSRSACASLPLTAL
jgi:hypothetical protein